MRRVSHLHACARAHAASTGLHVAKASARSFAPKLHNRRLSPPLPQNEASHLAAPRLATPCFTIFFFVARRHCCCCRRVTRAAIAATVSAAIAADGANARGRRTRPTMLMRWRLSPNLSLRLFMLLFMPSAAAPENRRLKTSIIGEFDFQKCGLFFLFDYARRTFRLATTICPSLRPIYTLQRAHFRVSRVSSV